MKSLGIVRSMDELGRVVVPMEFRREQGWKKGDSLEMFSDGDELVIRSFRKSRKKQEVLEKLTKVAESTKDKSVASDIKEAIDYVSGNYE